MNTRNVLKKYWLLGLAVVVLLSVGIFFLVRNWQLIQPDQGGRTIPGRIESSGITVERVALVEQGREGEGMVVSLSEGNPQPQSVQPVSYVAGEPLPEEEIDDILGRVPALEGESGDQADFRLAQEPIPPPRTGETIDETFPPPVQGQLPEEVEAGPLEVLRFSPEGEIPVAPFLSVTFNQPMVPLGTIEDLQEQDVPVQVEPDLPGTWRWLGTKTLTFEYDSALIDRLPKATEYKVLIPAGTRSATGGVLTDGVQWSFSTPPPRIVSKFPSDIPQPLEPLVFIAFDQRIDPEEVLKTIQVRAAGRSAGTRLASEEEIQADSQVRRLVKNTLEGRWLVFRFEEPLPPASSISVTVGPGTPSAEGSLVTQQAQSFGFQTYDALRIEDHGCSWGGPECRPLTPFYIRFNNPIDGTVFNESMLSIEPELPGAVVNIFGSNLEIRGATQARTTYTITVSEDIQDIFGQTLGKETRLTFKVGKAESRLFEVQESFLTLDPNLEKPSYSVYVTNYPRLEVQIYAVQPSDWPAFTKYTREWRWNAKTGELPGRKVFDNTIRVEAANDRLAEVPIDLSRYLDGNYGHFVLVVHPPKNLLENEQDLYWQTIQVWVQVTQIGLDAFNDHGEMVAWASSLQDGAPLSGVTITPGNGGQGDVTSEDGIARLPIPNGASYLVARKGADTAILPRSNYFWDESTWQSYTPNDELRWYVFDDRQMYRPGEQVHFKGWLRRIGGKQGGDVGLVTGAVDAVNYTINDSQGNELSNGRVDVNDLGGFHFVFEIPESVNLGYTSVYLRAEGSLENLTSWEYYHSFQIQEFRRPEFEVKARNETTGPYFAGEHAVVAVEAKYYAGDPLPNAEVTWRVSSSPSNYSPPNWPDFTFGAWQPWWMSYRYMAEEAIYVEVGQPYGETFNGLTDASGAHFLRLDFNAFNEPRPYSVIAEATVMDVNRQAWASTTDLLVHPADLYVGMRSKQYFVEKGTPLEIELIVTDLDGNPIEDRPITVTATRLVWKYQGGNWVQEETDPQNCQVGSADLPVKCTFETTVGGEYQITAKVSDSQGRQNQSSFTRWVSGGERPPSRKVEQEQVTLIPNQESYQPGDTARILVQAPFEGAEGLLTISRNGILSTQRFSIQESTYTLEVPIEDVHIPNLNIQVDLVGSAPRTDEGGEPIPGVPPRPAFATGTLSLSIPPLQRELSLQVTPQQTELEPGGETVLDLALKDASGRPVPGAELAVVVVDEAILALSNYQMVDPLSVFYSDRPSMLESRYGRSSIILADPLALSTNVEVEEIVEVEMAVQEEADISLERKSLETAAPMEAPAPAGMGAGEEAQPIRVRSDFNPLAVFAPEVRTDANGKAQVSLKLPDNLTRYRVMVVAVDDGKQFGMGEANVTARLPVMARPSAPRFLNFGDRFELPVVVQNQTGESRQVNVVVRASNLTLIGDTRQGVDATGISVEVPAHDRVEVRFPAMTERAGTARLQVVVTSGTFADAINIELPVYTPATTEAFATYGVVDEGAVFQPVSSPTGVFPQYGGLEITTSSTALQALTDAVLYLATYPYECSEQLASRILAIAALRDVLSAFEAEGLPSPDELEKSVVRDIERLQGMQNDDGGFPYWRRGQDSIPFNTIHVTHALQRAEMMGFEVPSEIKTRALEYLRDIESHYPHWYSRRTRQTLSAYALYIRDLSGNRDVEKARRLIDEAGLENLSLDAVGWLWQVLQDAPSSVDDLEAIRQLVGNRVVETAGAANFTTDYDETILEEENYLLLGSNRRTDAILLDAMIGDDPANDLIPKLVNGLLAHRVKGHWYNTQENVFVLLALDRYFEVYEAVEPDFVARIWLGETYAGEHAYRGYTTDQHETKVPMSYLVDESLGGGETQDLVISKDGEGRLYYRLGLRYAPTDLQLDPLDMGFVVQRSYEGVDNPKDVYRDEQGRWHIKAASRVRVRITMVADNRRYHVALADPLPAGLEIVNPALAVSGSVPADPNNQERPYGWWWWNWTWYEHQNLRDERAEAFTPLLWDGVYEYSYIARATTPGAFVVPPAKAEEMYSPEVFGRSSSDWVIVEP